MKWLKELVPGVFNGMKKFGSVINTLINSALLLVVYLIGVGISSLIGKLSRKKVLEKELQTEGSYWQDLNLIAEQKENYYKQF